MKDDPDDPSRRLIRQILGAVNEYERGMIRLRLRRGRQRKAERGEYAGGRPAFGYAAIAGELVPAPEEQAVIIEARKLRASGASIRAIAMESQSPGIRDSIRQAPVASNPGRQIVAGNPGATLH